MKKIWQDRHYIGIFIFLIALAWLSLGLLIFATTNLSAIRFLIIFIFCVIPLYIVANFLRTMLTCITKEGIRFGNAKDDSYQEFLFKRRPGFLSWDKIKEIEIIGRVIRRPYSTGLINILIVKSKDGKKHECFIANPKGFVKTIKDLKKSYLLAKDSKYIKSENKTFKFYFVYHFKSPKRYLNIPNYNLKEIIYEVST